nr:MAG TPA: hypothetical protein [Caudoviricetes sp.]
MLEKLIIVLLYQTASIIQVFNLILTKHMKMNCDMIVQPYIIIIGIIKSIVPSHSLPPQQVIC